MAAAHAKLADYAAKYPLTPALGDDIASALMSPLAVWKGRLASAEISSVRIDLRSAQNGDILNTPYYCVRVYTNGNFGIKFKFEHKVIIHELEPNHYVFQTLSSHNGRIYACENNVDYHPFPELERKLAN
jgi:hypothetical protein